jgi:ABC-type phosphate transport system auxiliary subunit
VNTVSIAVGVSVAVVVVAGLIVVLAVPSIRYTVFPFTMHESSKEKSITLDAENERSESSQWASVQPRTGSLTNVGS